MFAVRGKRGFTLLEMMISFIVFAVILLITLAALNTSVYTYKDTMTMAEIQERARDVVDRIAKEIRFSRPGESDGWDFADETELKTISFSTVEDFDTISGLEIWGEVITYDIQLAAGELDDDLDNNGNGLIDEAIVYRTQGGSTIGICNNMSYDNSRFYRVGNQIFIKFSAMKKNDERPDEPEKAHVGTYETMVITRNYRE